MLSELFIKVSRLPTNSELGTSEWYIWMKMRIFGQIEAKNGSGEAR